MHTGRTLTKNPSFLSNSSHSTSSPSSRISPSILTKKPSQEVISIHPNSYSSTSRITKAPQKESPLRSTTPSKTLIIQSSSANLNPSKMVRSHTEIFTSPLSLGSRSPSQGSPALPQKVIEYTEFSSSQPSLIKKDQVEISHNNFAVPLRKSEDRHSVDQNFSFETPNNFETNRQNKYEQLFYEKLGDLIQSLQDAKEDMSPFINTGSFSSKTWEVENSRPSNLFAIYKDCQKFWKSFDDYALKFLIRNQMRARENNGEEDQGFNCFLAELSRFEENLEAQKARIEEITSKRLKEKEKAGEYIDILTKGLADIKEKFNKDFDLVERQFETNRFTALLQSELKSMSQFTTQTYEKVQALFGPPPVMVTTQKKPIPQASPSYNSRSKEPTKDLIKKPGTSPSKSPLRKAPTARDTSPLSPTIKREIPTQNNNFQILKEYFEKMKDYNSRLIRIIHDVESEKLEIERLVLNAKDNIHLESNKLINQIEHSFSSRIRSLQTTDSSRSSQKVIGNLEVFDRNKSTPPLSDFAAEHKKEPETDAIDKIHSEFLLEEYKITTEDLSNKVRVLEEEAKNNRDNTSQQIQILLNKIQTLSNEYELYKEEKERNLKAIIETKEEEVFKFLAVIEQKDTLINIIFEENAILKKELNITSQIVECEPLPEETLDLEDFKNERNKYISIDMKETESPKDKKKKQAVESKTPKNAKENLLKEDNVLEMLFLELMHTKNKQKK